MAADGWVNDWNPMRELNKLMPRVGYHFFHASDDAGQQAERLVSAIRTHGLLPGENLVLDLESTGERRHQRRGRPGDRGPTR